MKQKITQIAVALLLNEALIAQITPIGTAPNMPVPNILPFVKNYTEQSWYRGGNKSGGVAGSSNILGTASGFNSSMFLQTDGGNRITLSHLPFGAPLQQYASSLTNPVFGNRLTRVGISRDGDFPITKPYCLLHLGYDTPISANNITPLGHRSWQDIGTMYQALTDNFYVGLRDKSFGDNSGRTSQVAFMPSDAQDAVISWGDNFSQNGNDPDNLRNFLTFIFHAPLNSTNHNFGVAGSDYGREIMRMDGEGNVGIGPVFYDNERAQNMLHLNNDGSQKAFLQFTNRTGSGQTVNDGFHIGIAAGSYNAELRQKESRDMAFFTNNIQRAVIKSSGWVGFNTNGPNNEVEIASRPATPYGITGSGLRFTNLKSTNAVTIPDNINGILANKVLTVDKSGDVVLINGGGSKSLVNTITLPIGNSNCLTGGTQIETGIDLNNDGVLQTTEVTQTQYVCNGAQGLIGLTGLTGATGPVGPIGLTGTQGPQGIQGIPGTSGGAVVAQNGLTNIGSNTLELGGTLLHNTNIDLNTSSFNFYSTSGNSNWSLANNGRIVHYSKSLSSVYDAGYDLFSDGFGAGLRLNLTNTSTGFDNVLTGSSHQLTGINSSITSLNSTAGSRAYGMLSQITAGVAENNVAVRGLVQLSNNTNIGLESEVRNGKTNIGVNVYVDRNIADPNGDIKDLYGIRSVVAPNNGGSNMNVGVFSAVGTGVTNPNNPGSAPYFYAGYFAGSVYVSGQIGGPSDNKLKQNVTPLANATDIIKQLQPKTFDYKHSSYPNMNLPQGLQYGLIAQEVESILPDVVTNNLSPAVKDSVGNITTPAETFKGLEYQQLIPILIQALKEQTAKVDSLQAKLNNKDSLQDARMSAIEAALGACCQNPNTSARLGSNTGASSTSATSIDIELSDKDVIVLTQNVPNPFAEQTIITYNVPSKVQKAQIIFYNAMGQIIETVDIKTRGKGKVNVFASDLSSGLYHYTLVADGKVVDSKKMVRE